jgi:hypothetical protein
MLTEYFEKTHRGLFEHHNTKSRPNTIGDVGNPQNGTCSMCTLTPSPDTYTIQLEPSLSEQSRA